MLSASERCGSSASRSRSAGADPSCGLAGPKGSAGGQGWGSGLARGPDGPSLRAATARGRDDHELCPSVSPR